MLAETVQKCLQVCDQKGAFSIAFPALGAGNLGYPSKVVAKVMITTVQNYYKINRTTCIKEVKFVIYKDDTHKEFEGLLLQQSTISTHNVDISENSPPYMSPIHNSTTSYAASSSHMPLQLQYAAVETFEIGKLAVEVVCGDITDDDSDVIVNTTQSSLQLATGTVSKAIVQKAGTIMQQKCQMYIDKHRQLTEGKICVTEATGKLKCKLVFHIVVPSSNKANKISQTVTTCLNEAECNKLNSIAIPAIGTGGLSYDPEVVAHGMYEAIVSFGQTNTLYLQQVRIVVFKKDMYQIYVQKFTELSKMQVTHSQGNIFMQYLRTISSTVKSYLFTSKQNVTKVKPMEYFIPETSTVQITIYAMTPSAVQRVEAELKGIISREFITLPIENEHIISLNSDQVSQIKEKATLLNLIVAVNPKSSKIQIKGRKDHAQMLETTIIEMLHNMEKEAITTEAIATVAQHERETHLTFQKKISWKYLLNGHLKEYDPALNYEIDQAYQLYKTEKKSSVFTYSNGNHNYIIHFDKDPMEVEDRTTGEILEIRRIDMIGGSA